MSGCLFEILQPSKEKNMTIPTDPFSLKQRSKLSPVRLVYTAWARWEERKSIRRFDTFALPSVLPTDLSQTPDYERRDTAVTPEQMAILIAAARMAETLEKPVVEIGAYRGVTTQLLASHCHSAYYAIDPYIGYGGAEGDRQIFHSRTAGMPTVHHLRMTSGQAGSHPGLEALSFCFIDAVHDYVNVRFDGAVWGSRIQKGGLLAFHDTDEPGFAGVRRAVWEQLNAPNSPWALWAHVEGLVVLQKIA